MSNELLLPIHNLTNTFQNKFMKWSFFEVMVLYVPFIIGDIYFSVHACGSPDVIVNVPLYFGLDAVMNFIWTIYIIILITNERDVTLGHNCHAYAFSIHYAFILLWNMVGMFLLSDLLEYSCRVEMYNYLFVKIIINEFHCICKLFKIYYDE